MSFICKLKFHREGWLWVIMMGALMTIIRAKNSPSTAILIETVILYKYDLFFVPGNAWRARRDGSEKSSFSDGTCDAISSLLRLLALTSLTLADNSTYTWRSHGSNRHDSSLTAAQCSTNDGHWAQSREPIKRDHHYTEPNWRVQALECFNLMKGTMAWEINERDAYCICRTHTVRWG